MQIFEIVADPTRRRILDLLAGGEQSAGALCDQFDVSQPAVSRHLRVLREAGLVRCRTDAQRRLYTLEPAPLAEVDRWLERYRGYWTDRLDALDAHLRSRKKPRRGKKT